MNAPLALLATHPQPLFANTTVVVVVVVLVLLALIAGGIWLRFSTVRKRLARRFEDFKDRVMGLRQQVEKIKERHQLLPAQNNELQGMTGRTLAVYQQVDADVKRLWDGWLQRMDTWDQVQKALESARVWQTGKLLEAERMLDQLAFDEVDRGCKTCVEHLDRLEQGHQQARTLVTSVQALFEPQRQQIGSVGALGLAVAPYEPELAQCVELHSQAEKMLQGDPIGAGETLTEARTRLDRLQHWVADVVEQFHRRPKVRAELEQAERVASGKRAGGLLLSEPEGNPDPLLARGRVAYDACEPALQRGEAQEAREHLDEGSSLAAQAQGVIERQEEARSFCASAIPARREDGRRLQQTLGLGQGWQAELMQDFAPDSWRAVADHLDQSSSLLDNAGANLNRAEDLTRDDTQYYFQAAALLEQAEQLQQQASGLLHALEGCLRDLQELRRDCSRRAAELGVLARETTEYFTLSPGSIRPATAGQLAAAGESLFDVQRTMERPRANWRQVSERLQESRQAYVMARKEAEEDVRQHQELMRRLGQVNWDVDRVGTFLRQHSEIRAETARTFSRAVESLEEVRLHSTGGTSDWSRLLRQVEEAVAALAKAEKQGQDDLKLAGQASAAVDEAGRELWQVQSTYKGGSSELTQAERLLEQARRELANQSYEAATTTAKQALQAARKAREAAERAAHSEAERQRKEAAAAMAPPPPVETSWPQKTPEDAPISGGYEEPRKKEEGAIGGYEEPRKQTEDDPIGGHEHTSAPSKSAE